MNRKKAFWLSLLIALAVLLPIYTAVWAKVIMTRPHSQEAAASESGISVDKAAAGDSRNLFIAVKGEEPLFFLLRIDAFQGKASVAGLRTDTLLRAKEGGTVTLKSAWDYAGPGYASTLCAETLGIKIDNYIQLTADTAVSALSSIGAVRLNESDLELAQASGVKTRSDTAALSAQNIADLVRLAKLPTGKKAPFTALCLVRFIDTGADKLSSVLDTLLRSSQSGLSTDIFADEIYEYTHITDFFTTSPPVCSQVSFAGLETAEGFELATTAPDTAMEKFS